MLPFLKQKPVAGLIISHRKADGSKGEEYSQGEENHALEACAEDIIRAINSKDAKALATALKSAWECLEVGLPSEDNDFDSQNEKAAEQD